MMRNPIVFVVTFVALGACGARNPGSVGASSAMGPDVVELTVSGTTFTSGEPAQLRASFGSSALIDFWISGVHGGASVGIDGRVSPSDVGKTNLSLALTNGPIMDGVASISTVGLSSTPNVAGAVVNLALSANAVQGTVSWPNGTPWSFKGSMAVSCWVPQSEVAGAGTNAGGIAAANALVNDADFQSAACQGLAGLAGK